MGKQALTILTVLVIVVAMGIKLFAEWQKHGLADLILLIAIITIGVGVMFWLRRRRNAQGS